MFATPGHADGIHLAVAELKDPVKDELERYSIYETIDPGHYYPTIKTAVGAYREEARLDGRQISRAVVSRARFGTWASGGIRLLVVAQ